MSLFSFIKKLFTKVDQKNAVNDQITDSVTQVVVETQITDSVTQVVESEVKPNAEKAKKPKAKVVKKIELTPEQSEKIVKELKNKGVYSGSPKKKKQK